MTIASVQIVRKAVLVFLVLVGLGLFAVGTCAYDHRQGVHEVIRWAGVFAIVLCIFGRTWCTLYIGGRKIEQLITAGPYSVCRNPLYLFSVLGAAGSGAQFGSVISAVSFGALVWAVFHVVVLKEEQLLLVRHGTAFTDYLASVPRFLPDFRLWHDVPTLTIQPRNVLTTFGDAVLIMLWLPLSMIFEYLHNSGLLPVLIALP